VSKARLVITAVLIEGRSQSQVARDYGVSQSWISRLIARYTLEGDAAFEPRSRRPHTSPTRLPQATIDLIVALRTELTGKGLDAGPHTINVHQINSTPNHPTTCGKVERFHQTLKRWLTHQPRATTLTELQTQLNTFVDEYNHRRPHRSLPHNATPATIYNSRPKADPATRIDTHNRVRTDRVDQAGSITLRHNGRLHHIGIGRIHHRTRVLILVHDLNITIINAATGEVLRELTLDPTRDYQPTGAPKGPTRKKPQT